MVTKGTSLRIAIVMVGMILLLPALTLAQTTGRVTGRVLDQTGAALPGVTIDLAINGTELTTTSNVDGQFGFDGVPVGRAELTFRLINFSVARRMVDIRGGASAAADVVLTLALNADVVVTGQRTFRNIADMEDPAANLVGIAASASQGAITAAQLEVRPMMRPGEVLETVPGLIVSQHSGEGKANQYYVRGFNLDHGTDFSTTVAGVPVNTPTGAHAHGYTDTSFLIPELVSGVQFKKGPYFADEGDFSAAGAANINYVNQLDRASVSLSGGQDGWRRLFGAASPRVGAGYLLGAVEAGGFDGPWVRPDNYRKLNTVLRYSRGDNRNGLSVTGMGYWADWNATDQVPERAIASGEISRFGYVDGSDGGQADRQSLSAEFQRSSGPASLRASGFVLHNNLKLFSNFTYFLENPDRGDQFEQAEARTTVGGRLTYRRLGHFFDRHTESAVGAQVRRDWLDPVGLYRTAGRQRVGTTREDRVDQTIGGVYAQTEIEWARSIRTTVGMRADVYQFSVTSSTPENSGNGSSGLVSPKFGAAFGPWAGTEVYANAGMGYHSNDARGTVIRVDPASGEVVDRVTPLVRAKGAEVGLRTVRINGLQSTVALWYLDLDSELLFVGDAGTTEPGRPSRRVGLEWTNYARLASWLTVDADFALSRARFRGDDPAGNYIPGALDTVISAGLAVEARRPLFGSVRVRHFGPRPLVEDASVVSRGTTLWNGELGYRLTSKARLVLELFNLFNADVSDIDYFYASRLSGESANGVEDIHTHPALPRSARFGLQLSF
jgi:hypothetical protein